MALELFTSFFKGRKEGDSKDTLAPNESWSTTQRAKHLLFGGAERIDSQGGREFIYKYDGVIKRFLGLTVGLIPRVLNAIARECGVDTGTAEWNIFASKEWKNLKREEARAIQAVYNKNQPANISFSSGNGTSREGSSDADGLNNLNLPRSSNNIGEDAEAGSVNSSISGSGSRDTTVSTEARMNSANLGQGIESLRNQNIQFKELISQSTRSLEEANRLKLDLEQRLEEANQTADSSLQLVRSLESEVLQLRSIVSSSTETESSLRSEIETAQSMIHDLTVHNMELQRQLQTLQSRPQVFEDSSSVNDEVMEESVINQPSNSEITAILLNHLEATSSNEPSDLPSVLQNDSVDNEAVVNSTIAVVDQVSSSDSTSASNSSSNERPLLISLEKAEAALKTLAMAGLVSVATLIGIAVKRPDLAEACYAAIKEKLGEGAGFLIHAVQSAGNYVIQLSLPGSNSDSSSFIKGSTEKLVRFMELFLSKTPTGGSAGEITVPLTEEAKAMFSAVGQGFINLISMAYKSNRKDFAQKLFDLGTKIQSAVSANRVSLAMFSTVVTAYTLVQNGTVGNAYDKIKDVMFKQVEDLQAENFASPSNPQEVDGKTRSLVEGFAKEIGRLYEDYELKTNILKAVGTAAATGLLYFYKNEVGSWVQGAISGTSESLSSHNLSGGSVGIDQAVGNQYIAYIRNTGGQLLGAVKGSPAEIAKFLEEKKLKVNMQECSTAFKAYLNNSADAMRDFITSAKKSVQEMTFQDIQEWAKSKTKEVASWFGTDQAAAVGLFALTAVAYTAWQKYRTSTSAGAGGEVSAEILGESGDK
jgi:hypothetical protein